MLLFTLQATEQKETPIPFAARLAGSLCSPGCFAEAEGRRSTSGHPPRRSTATLIYGWRLEDDDLARDLERRSKDLPHDLEGGGKEMSSILCENRCERERRELAMVGGGTADPGMKRDLLQCEFHSVSPH